MHSSKNWLSCWSLNKFTTVENCTNCLLTAVWRQPVVGHDWEPQLRNRHTLYVNFSSLAGAPDSTCLYSPRVPFGDKLLYSIQESKKKEKKKMHKNLKKLMLQVFFFFFCINISRVSVRCWTNLTLWGEWWAKSFSFWKSALYPTVFAFFACSR